MAAGDVFIVIQTTLNKNENVSVLLLQCKKTSNDYVFSRLLYETLEISSTQPVSSPYFGIDNLVKFDIVGSSNGLVCLLGLFPLNIAIWNLATKEAKVFPESHVSNPQGGAQIRDLGIGLEVKTTEYKVVKILEIYDRNPKLTNYDLEFFYEAEDHLNTFKTILGLQQPPPKISCRSFTTTLKGAAREWFTKLPTSSIDNFEQLSNAFLHHFVGGQRPKRPVDHLLTIRQREKETLRSYVKRFTCETLEVDEADNKVQLTTFKAGLKSKEFVVSLVKIHPKTIAEMLLKAQKYMNAKDALAAIKDVEKLGDMGRKEGNHRGQKREHPDHRTNDGGKRKDEKTPRMDEHYLKWPRPLHSSSNVHDMKKYCRFHKDHGHYTEDCRDLKEQIEDLIQKGKLQKYVKNGESSKFRYDNKNHHKFSPNNEDCTSQRPPNVIREIKTIISGPSTSGSFKSLKKVYQRQENSVHRMPPFKQRQMDRNMCFSEENARGVKQPYDDPLVMMLVIEGFNTRRILVDNGSLAEIIYLSTFQQLNLDPGRLRPFDSPSSTSVEIECILKA
ncbi:uncharacterized protein LOC111986229 [Quercus suber]|uniref:uncharacterized protein LOC111986229 n=1 Tax=Quercus suber TaxID=58331 RepID=UPI000CE25B84|nr:uncharacterized protein LOC111986229 [Quercus suber]